MALVEMMERGIGKRWRVEVSYFEEDGRMERQPGERKRQEFSTRSMERARQ